MTTTQTCPRCGSAVFGTLLNDLCPHCVAASALGSAEGSSRVREIGGYEVLDELGRGGMGIVCLARQRSLDRLVALKILVGGAYAGAAAEERFLREAREAARLHHPNIVAIHEVGRHEGRPFYSMDLVEGEDIVAYAAHHQPNPRESAILVMKAARAVQHAHDSGVLHRDLKPTNVLVDAAGEPHVMDFGLVVAIDGSDGLTRTGEVLGSPSYMAPEQLRGEATVVSDVYGLGAVLYFLVTGRPPFVAAQLPELIAAVERGDPLPPRCLDPSLPQDLETIALHALARDPARRYASVAKLAEDLQRWLAGRTIRARPVSIFERARHWARRHRPLAIMAAILTMSVLLGVAGVVSHWRRAEHAARNTALTLYSADLKVASDALLAGDLGLARIRLEACPVGLRDSAWGLLWPLTRGETETEIGSARWTVTHLAVSRDGALAASTAQADNVRLWNLATAQPLGELADTTYAWWAAFSPDGTQLFTADRTVKQWDLAQRRVIREFHGQSGALSRDGAILYTCDGQKFLFEGEPGGVTAWRVSDGHALFNLPVKARIISVSPDGKLLAVSDAQNWIALYNARDGQVVRENWPSVERIWSLTFSPDSSLLVESGWSTGVRVWNLTQPTAKPQLLGHPLFTWDAEFSSDGGVLAIACSDRQVHLWDTRTWQQIRVLRGHFNEVWALAWQPDGRLLSAGRDARVLRMREDATSEKRYARQDVYSFNIVWMGDDRLATVRKVDGGGVAEIAPIGRTGNPVRFAGEIPIAFDAKSDRLWLWADGRELRARRAAELNDVVRVPLNLAKGEKLAGVPQIVPEAGRAGVALTDRSLAVYRSDDGRRVGRYENLFAHPTDAMALSPDGRRFVWGGVSTELFMLDLDTGRRVSLRGHRYEVSCVAFAPDGQTFLSGGADGLIIEWDARTGQRLRELGRHATSVGRLAYSPDGKVVFSQEQGVGVHLWHPATGREVGFIPEKRAEANQWLGVSPDAHWFGVRLADGTIRTIRIATPTGALP